MKTYQVAYRRDHGDDVWLVRVSADERLHSYGRTIARAREAIRDVIALWHEVPDEEIELDESYELGKSLDVRSAIEARDEALAAEQRAMAETADAARRLHRRGISYRDAADILGISYQRVHQLVREG